MTATVGRCLLLALLSLYLLTMAGHTASPDEESLFYVARSLAEHGRLDLPPDCVETTVYRLPGPDGRLYSPYGILPSLLQAPLVAAASALATRATPRHAEYLRRFAAGLVDPAATALTAWLLLGLLLDLGAGAGVSLLAALAFAIATPAWVYARNLWSEPVTSLFLLLAVLLAVHSNREGRVGAASLAGLALGLAAAAKAPTLVVVPGFLVYLLFRRGGRRPSLLRIPAFVLGLGVPGVLMAWSNHIRFGDALETGYQSLSPPDAFTRAPLLGLLGIVASPGKGLLVYAPLALVALAGLPALVRRRPAEAGLLVWLVLSHVVFYGSYYMWHGDVAWGPRYLVPVLPYVVAPAAFVLEGRRACRAAFALAAALGLVVNLEGVLVDPAAYAIRTGGTDTDLADARRWVPGMSPVVGHLRILRERALGWARHRDAEVLLAEGFYDPEDPSGAPLPRWTAAHAELDVSAPGARVLALHLRYGSYRPEPLAPACLDLVAGSVPLAARIEHPSREPFDSVAGMVRPPGAGERVTVSLEVEPWVPARDAGLPDRRELGVVVTALGVRADGRALTVGAPWVRRLPVTGARPWGRVAWSWFHREPHVVDLWPWHVWHSGLPRALVLLALLPAAGLVLGARGLARAARAR